MHNISLKPKDRMLSTETMTALQHTLNRLMEISSLFFEEKHFDHVLVDKFKTDNLKLIFD